MNELARSIPAVVPFKQEDKPFHDGLRAEIFNDYKDDCADGDWWCRLDADEFYIDDPRVFLAKVPQHQRVVVTASLSYYFTDKDSARYEEDPSCYADSVPVVDKCRYYLNHWSEPRFFRALPWPGLDRRWVPRRNLRMACVPGAYLGATLSISLATTDRQAARHPERRDRKWRIRP